MSNVSVMSFNLRVAAKSDGINYQNNRLDRIRSLLFEESPDLVGFQEVSYRTLDWLTDTLSRDYLVLGCGREVGCAGEGVALAVKRSKFLLRSLDTFWLSDTPDIPGSRFEATDQSPCPRIAQIVRLQPRDGSLPFYFCNTHLDHRGTLARAAGFSLLWKRLSPLSRVILTGDMNATPESPEITGFLSASASRGWKDATSNLGGTFHGFGTHCPAAKIDYIFTDLLSTEARVAVREPIRGIYPSDHHPVVATVEL